MQVLSKCCNVNFIFKCFVAKVFDFFYYLQTVITNRIFINKNILNL